MAKECIFCGRPPTSKTKEHVVPLWLIRLTGNPKRLANFGPRLDEPGTPWMFPFDNFQFPACSRCNDFGAKLEDQIAPLFSRLLDRQPITGLEFSALLDWFDKVRIGFWLGMRLLNKNPSGIRPQFYIKDRIRLYDRALIMMHSPKNLPPLGFSGTFGPAFQFSPVAFSARVSDITFINVSYASLCSAELGFPHVRDGQYVSLGGPIKYQASPASGIFQPPFAPSLPRLPRGGELFLQPIASGLLKGANTAHLVEHPHVERFSKGMPPGAGQVFRILSDGSPTALAFDEPQKVVPRTLVSPRTAMYDALKYVTTVQETSFKSYAGTSDLTEQERAYWDTHVRSIARVNAFIRQHALDGLKELGYL